MKGLRMKQRNTNLIRQFNLILVIVFLISIVTTGAFLSTWLYGEVERNMDRQVMLLLNLMQSNRDYTSDHVKARLMEHEPDPDYFVPELVPSYAAHQTFEDFASQDLGTELIYKEATINPTNLRDRADKYEEHLIHTFQTTQTMQLSGYRPWPSDEHPGQRMYYVSRPLVVDRDSCLVCHGAPSAAPQAMIDMYGDRNGFNWELGEVIAAQTVYIPSQNLVRQTLGELGRWMPINLGVFVGLALLVNQLLKRTIIRPIMQITSVARRLSEPNQDQPTLGQRYGPHLSPLGNRRDELGHLARSFQYMLQVLANREQDLQQAVTTKTTELAQAKQLADQANQAKSNFLAHMSHELRTPLNAILGFSQLMQRDRSLSAEQKDTVAIINNNGEHLLDLINEVLDLAKIEAGKLELNTTPVNLHRLISTVQQLFYVKASEKKIALQVEYGATDTPLWIHADERKLRQVLINLVGNALKFTSTGSVRICVTLGLPDASGQDSTVGEKGRSSCFYIAVSDTGPGIDPEAIETIFTPFGQSETGRQSGQGTGLGLPISRQCIELMGGTLDVISTLNEGTTFQIGLPYRPAEPVSDDGPKTWGDMDSSADIVGVVANHGRSRILVVDDTTEGRQLLVQLLTPLGFEVREAGNGEEAIAQWQRWQPHLICMDLRMPVMDGCEATRHIKQRSGGLLTVSDLPIPKILMLTASAFTHEQATVKASGCDAYLSKPFKTAELLATIGQLLDITYEYAQPVSSDAVLRSPGSKPTEAPELQFQYQPPQWLADFHAAVLALDETMMRQLISALPHRHRELQVTLMHWVDHLDFETILQALEPYC